MQGITPSTPFKRFAAVLISFFSLLGGYIAVAETPYLPIEHTTPRVVVEPQALATAVSPHPSFEHIRVNEPYVPFHFPTIISTNGPLTSQEDNTSLQITAAKVDAPVPVVQKTDMDRPYTHTEIKALMNSETSYGNELGCLAMNIYQEARGEPEKGKLAVAAVTMNRVKNKHYPSTVCGVVWQPKQFSWTRLKIKYHVIKNTRAWEKALIIAQRFMEGEDWSGVGEATHYHAMHVSPNWKEGEDLIVQVGNHLFYAL